LATVAAAHLGGGLGVAGPGLPRVDAGEAEGEGEDEALEHGACGLRITSNGRTPSRRQCSVGCESFCKIKITESQTHEDAWEDGVAKGV